MKRLLSKNTLLNAILCTLLFHALFLLTFHIKQPRISGAKNSLPSIQLTVETIPISQKKQPNFNLPPPSIKVGTAIPFDCKIPKTPVYIPQCSKIKTLTLEPTVRLSGPLAEIPLLTDLDTLPLNESICLNLYLDRSTGYLICIENPTQESLSLDLEENLFRLKWKPSEPFAIVKGHLEIQKELSLD